MICVIEDLHEVDGEDSNCYRQPHVLGRTRVHGVSLEESEGLLPRHELTIRDPSVVTTAASSFAHPSINTATLEIAQPAIMKGRRRPSEDRQPSLRTPTIGWTNSPDNGPVQARM